MLSTFAGRKPDTHNRRVKGCIGARASAASGLDLTGCLPSPSDCVRDAHGVSLNTAPTERVLTGVKDSPPHHDLSVHYAYGPKGRRTESELNHVPANAYGGPPNRAEGGAVCAANKSA